MIDLSMTTLYLTNIIFSICLADNKITDTVAIKCMNYYNNCTLRQKDNKLIMKDTPNCEKLKLRWEKSK